MKTTIFSVFPFEKEHISLKKKRLTNLIEDIIYLITSYCSLLIFQESFKYGKYIYIYTYIYGILNMAVNCFLNHLASSSNYCGEIKSLGFVITFRAFVNLDCVGRTFHICHRIHKILHLEESLKRDIQIFLFTCILKFISLPLVN